jgi:hypothetical protein
VPDRLVFWGILIRLTTEVFHQLRAEALAAFDRIIGLDLSEVAVEPERTCAEPSSIKIKPCQLLDA